VLVEDGGVDRFSPQRLASGAVGAQQVPRVGATGRAVHSGGSGRRGRVDRGCSMHRGVAVLHTE